MRLDTECNDQGGAGLTDALKPAGYGFVCFSGSALPKRLLILLLTALVVGNPVQLIAGGGHQGHGGGGGNKAGGGKCKSTLISHIKPEHLASVKPQADISFWVAGISDPRLVEVTAKNIPVEVTAENKQDFFLFKGKLPDSLKGPAARVVVKVNYAKCPAEKGWLLKISE